MSDTTTPSRCECRIVFDVGPVIDRCAHCLTLAAQNPWLKAENERLKRELAAWTASEDE